MINWGLGYSASYHATLVDPITMEDIGYGDEASFDITGGSISRTDTDLRQSADISTVDIELERESWIRVYMIATQGVEKQRIPIFTGLAITPSKNVNGRRTEISIQCYSVLKPLQDILLPKGWFVDTGVSCTNIIRQLTDPISNIVTIAPTDAMFDDYIIAENNETYLSMLDAVLTSMNWRIRIDGYGRVSIGPYANEPAQIFDGRSNDVLEPQVKIDNDWYGCPNVLRVTTNYDEYIEYDYSDSIYSIPSRGRQVWAEESNCNLTNGESLEFYAKRRLKELQDFAVKVSYQRSYDPAVFPTDVVRINYPEYDISGVFYVTSQTVTLGYGSATQEEVIQL